MRIAVSVDMEGASQLRSVREIVGCFPEYWATGRPSLEADVVAACEGLLAGGATELVLFDNHGGNTVNFSPDLLPVGASVETWHAYDLHEHGFDAMFQVGYHARAGVNGFLSHTYVPGLRLRLGDEPISESHRIWACELPLLGITGNDLHEQTLGSLAGTPFLVVQRSRGRGEMTPVYEKPEAGLDAIRAFAAECVRNASSRRPVKAPTSGTLEASLPNGDMVVAEMTAAGWQRVGEVEFAFPFEQWSSTRDPIGAAMSAGLAPFLPYLLGGFHDAAAAAAADPQRVALLRTIFDAWGAESYPEWYTRAADPLPAGVRERLG